MFLASHTLDFASSPGTWTVAEEMTNRSTATPPVGVASSVFDVHALDAGPTPNTTATYSEPADLVGVTLTIRPEQVIYEYDDRGNRTSRTGGQDTTTYAYDSADRLTSVTNRTADTDAFYAYDATGLRVAKTVGDDEDLTRFTWSRSSGLPLMIAENDTYFVYGPGNRILEEIEPVPPITYLGGTRLSTPYAPTIAMPVPSVEHRDLILLSTTVPADHNATAPADFSLVADTTTGITRSLIWSKIVGRDGAARSVTITYSPGTYDYSTSIAAWRNIDPDEPFEGAPVTTTAEQAATITTGQGQAMNQWGNQAVVIAATYAPGAYGGHTSTVDLATPQHTTARPHLNPVGESRTRMFDEAVLNGTVGPYQTQLGPATRPTDLVVTLLVLNHERPPGRYHHLDQLGSVRATTNEYAELVHTTSYSPYGQPRHQPATATTPINLDFGGTIGPSGLGFAGEYHDGETGHLYLRARYHDPDTAQFLTRDPLLDVSGDPYAYGNNDPINTVDPTGLIGFEIGPVKVGDGCPLGRNPNGSCRGSDIKNSIATAGVVAGVAAITISTGGLGGVAIAGTSFTLGTVGTVATAASAGTAIAVAYDDCRRGSTAACLVSAGSAVASTVGGGLSTKGAALAGSAGDWALLGGPMRVMGDALFGGWGLGLGIPGLFGYPASTADC